MSNPRNEALHIRAQLKSIPRFNLEFKAAISTLCRNHGVEVSDEFLNGLTLSTVDELHGATTDVPILPKPNVG
ncbi:MAG: hypothetical protein V4732_02705 [Pseudomonadota bacterium]